MEYLPKEDIWITPVEMPMRIKGFCKFIDDCNCAIINANLSPAAALRALDHEVGHLEDDDLHSEESVEELENKE